MGRTPFIGIDPAYGDDYGCEIIGYKDRKGVFYIIEERFFVRGDDTPQKVDFREQWDQCRYTWGNGKWEWLPG